MLMMKIVSSQTRDEFRAREKMTVVYNEKIMREWWCFLVFQSSLMLGDSGFWEHFFFAQFFLSQTQTLPSYREKKSHLFQSTFITLFLPFLLVGSSSGRSDWPSSVQASVRKLFLIGRLQ